MSLTSIIAVAFGLVACWVSYAEDRKEKRSMATLAPEDLTEFLSTFRMSRPIGDYPAALQAHAAIARPARQRKLYAALALLVIIVGYIFIGP